MICLPLDGAEGAPTLDEEGAGKSGCTPAGCRAEGEGVHVDEGLTCCV